MKLTKIILTAAAPVAALSLGTVLMTPGTTEGYSLIGGSLSQNQRDVRVYNNFTDNAANNNQTPDDQFPGYQGAVMAIWKGAVEWGSEIHGDGTGDPHQNGGLGSGGANFDPSFQGEATGVGGTNNNIHSELSGSSGGVLAYCETPISDGWRIRYYSGWTWNDGPGTNISGVDLQGVACHEFGHAIGLGHSNTGNATMFPSISGAGVGQRSIATDDSNGVKAVYGTKSSTKPHIASVAVNSGQITITGNNFDATGNQIWFTQASAGGNGTPVKVTGLSSPDGVTLTAAIPSNAGPGDVLVRRNSTAHSGLSNAFPADLMGGSTGGGGAPTIGSISPATIDSVTPDVTTVTVTGTNFTATTNFYVDGVELTNFPPQYSVVNDNTITFGMPLASKLGNVDITVTNPSGSVTSTINVVVPSAPVVDLVNSDPSFLLQGVGLDINCGGNPGDIVFIGISPQLLPTALPGLIDQPLAIGNNFTTLYQLGHPTIGATGYAAKHIPLSGNIPSGTQLHVQTATLRLSNLYAFPAEVSNVESGTILF